MGYIPAGFRHLPAFPVTRSPSVFAYQRRLKRQVSESKMEYVYCSEDKISPVQKQGHKKSRIRHKKPGGRVSWRRFQPRMGLPLTDAPCPPQYPTAPAPGSSPSAPASRSLPQSPSLRDPLLVREKRRPLTVHGRGVGPGNKSPRTRIIVIGIRLE